METKKKCSKCGKTKPLSEFGVVSRNKDGHDYMCRMCRRKRNRRQYEEHTEKRKAAVLENQRENRRELEWYREHYPQEGKPWNEQQ